MNTVWLLVPALRRLGYGREADRILASCVELVERHGFREYYNPLNGEGLAARRFGFSTLLVDLLPAIGEQGVDASDAPFVGSVPNELWSMGTEAVAETRRRLIGRAPVVRFRRPSR
jgi:hypothetical protein